MFSRKEIIIWVFAAVVGITLAYSCRLEAGEWNEKPVMCADEEETFEAIYRKKEILILSKMNIGKKKDKFSKLELALRKNLKKGKNFQKKLKEKKNK